MSANLKHYLTKIENALKDGNATEHSHRPALKALLEELDLSITATNEPKRIACGAPDYLITRNQVTIGYLEAKDVGKSLHETERTDQLKRYRRALDNLILTDYLEFRWYVDGDLRQEARLARPQSGGKLNPEKGGLKAVEELLQNFLAHQAQGINTPKDLAQGMARLTHIIRDIIIAAFETEQASMLLQGWRDAFAKVLIADLLDAERTADFADMFAQTLAYGLFTARVMYAPTTPDNFTRPAAQYLIPKSNPFLRDFFIQITGPQLDDEPFASFVDDLVNLLANTDMEAILADFGRRTQQEDPVVHFYETFLAAYDPKLRQARGVYYTPEPVVSYIVRSVDDLLKTRFNCPQGLADSSKISTPNYDPSLKVKGKNQARKTIESHKVLVLDPATGTGTFLYAVIDHIRQQFMQQGNAGLWNGYVKNHLLPRLFGFELLMAPYAVAHFKLSLQLAGRDLPDTLTEQWAYHPAEGERLGVYLTNALAEAHEMSDLPLFTQWVADETKAANKVKQRLPVLVVMGNPPYSYESTHTGEWISLLIRDYYRVDDKPLAERNPKGLQDDYVKFIRFGQWRIEQSGGGILAFISNHGYLDNPTFRGMRQSLIQTFSEIYILDLHGNAKKREVAPDGSKDENVFDIQQGVGIGIFIKQPAKNSPAKVYHADLWGTRVRKYEQLFEQDVAQTEWTELKPQAPFYLFISQDSTLLPEYNQGWKVVDIFPTNSAGIVTSRDHFALDFDESRLRQRIEDFRNTGMFTDDEIRNTYKLRDTQNWELSQKRKDLAQDNRWEGHFSQCLYRPFDTRAYYHSNHIVERPRYAVMSHVLAGENLNLITTRQVTSLDFCHVLCSRHLIELKVGSHDRNTNLFPLYLYPTEDTVKQKTLMDTSNWPPDEANGGRIPNLNPEFVAEMARKLGLTFTSHLTQEKAGTGVADDVFGPEDIFHYSYALFHSPTYRSRYAEFLKIDFPRLPLTAKVDLFRALCVCGEELVRLHLLESPTVEQFNTRYPIAGDNRVEKGYPKYQPPQEGQSGRVKINKTQYFEGVSPQVWGFYIGGYQVLAKWLKDRRGRQLAYDDLTHYQQTVVALQKTIDLMAKIDEVIPEWPI